MTAPYSSALLNEPVSVEENTIPRPNAGGSQRSAALSSHATTIGGTADEQARREEAAYAAGARAAAAERGAATRPVSYQAAPQYAPALAPAYAAPQPQVVYVAAPGRGNGIGAGMSAVSMSLVVLVIAIVAGVAAYVIVQQNAPSAQEAARVASIASDTAFLNGRTAGFNIGQQWGQQVQGEAAAMNAKIAGERAYANGLAAGKKAGAASYKPTPYRSYGGGYRGRSYGYGNGAVSQGLAEAQNLANATGAPVDVEIY